MPTPSGTIKFSDIENEFGQSPNQSLGDYRLNGGKTIGNLQAPLDTGVPISVAAGSSSISFDQLRNKKLNIHVDYYSMSSNIDRHDDANEYEFKADNRYNAGHRVAVAPEGAAVNIPGTASGTGNNRIVINVGKKIGSEKSTSRDGGTGKCALRTGDSWNSDTELTVHVSEGGMLVGAGGDGGDGGSGRSESGTVGKAGSSALGIQFEETKVRVDEGGAIIAGRGGGGGGGAGFQEDSECDGWGPWYDCDEEVQAATGGAGGGGAGRPKGLKGGGASVQQASDGNNYSGDSPFDGNWQSAGGQASEGGYDGREDSVARGGDGGTGGTIAAGANDGGVGYGNGKGTGGSFGTVGGAINKNGSVDWAFEDTSSYTRVYGAGRNGAAESQTTVE
tara:strand:- start:1310 stop:2482 length:1173 start_codon:yes stop_codon:yes gene_type:complete